MSYQYEINEYYKVKKDGDYPWPCNSYKGRTIQLFTDDILTKKKDGTYTKHTGLCCFGIILSESEVEFADKKTILQVI